MLQSFLDFGKNWKVQWYCLQVSHKFICLQLFDPFPCELLVSFKIISLLFPDIIYKCNKFDSFAIIIYE